MTTLEILDRLQGDALKDGELRKSFWQPVWKRILSLFFADYAGNLAMNCMKLDLVSAGEDFYATMRRSTNGGGEKLPEAGGGR